MKTVCACVERLCVHGGPPHAPRCHSIHPVISNYGETQVFATASLGLPDLICSTPSVNQPLTRRSMARNGPRFSSRICRRGLWGIITCIWGREDDDSKWIFYLKKGIRLLLLQWTQWHKCRIYELKNLKVQKMLQKAKWRTWDTVCHPVKHSGNHFSLAATHNRCH